MQTKVDKATLQALRTDIAAVLGPIAAKHGLAKLELGRCTYDPDAGSFKFNLDGVAEGGMTPDQTRYELHRANSPWWPVRGTMILCGRQMVEVDGMTGGGRIVVKDKAGKDGLMKYADFERRYPRPAPTAEQFKNFQVPAPAVIPGRIRK